MLESNRSDAVNALIAQSSSAQLLPIITAQEERRSAGIALIDESPLRRSVIANMLRAHIRKGAQSFGEAAELLNQVTANCNSPSCVVVCVGSRSLNESALLLQLRQLVRAMASVPVVILSDRNGHKEVVIAFSEGARGYIPTSLQPTLVIHALKIILAGGTFAPAEVLIRAPSPAPAPANGTSPAQTEQRWPARQLAVLQLLVRGKGNKEISNALGLEDSTVKADVRIIMRKLGAANRTEAALLARQSEILTDRSRPERDAGSPPEHAS